ncbi:MAG: hypothetical protein ACKV2T_31860 [Kofleriaceae bacterium]
MSDPIQRPRYYEGQVLAADDLTAGLDYTRAQAARHNRLVHRWGIVDGLALTTTPRSGGGANWVEVRVSAGMALDGTGREIIVPEDVLLDERAFERRRVTVGDPDALYPVVIAGTDLGATPPPTTRKCTPARASRTIEGWTLDFAAPGFETHLEAQTAPRVDAGAGGALGSARWWVLLGYVKWDATLRRFTAIAHENAGVGRTWIGVRADEVEGRGGRVLIRTRAVATSQRSAAALVEGKLGAALQLGTADQRGHLSPRVSIDSEGTIESSAGKLAMRAGAAGIANVPVAEIAKVETGGTFTFGLQQPGGQLAKLMFVDEHGNLTIAGRFTGAFASVPSVRVASGVASHGTILPLPEGVTQAQVDAGQVRLHVQVTPRACGARPWDAPATIPNWVGSPSELWVDGDRRVHCRVHWIAFVGSAPRAWNTDGVCDFVVTAVSLPQL